jgi:hypothetical protein
LKIEVNQAVSSQQSFVFCLPFAVVNHSAKCQIGIGIFVTKEKKQWKIQSNEKIHSDFRKLGINI